MFGAIVLAGSIGFLVFAVLRLRMVRSWLNQAAVACGVTAGALAIVHHMNGADSRWLVGGILLAVGGLMAPLATRLPVLRIVASVLGALATLLLAIATVTAR